MKLFNYTPSEKIIISLYDASDYGFASATSVPENFIRLEIEPFEHAYENIPFDERFQWVLSHELVHIVVDDHASDIEAATRKVFSKVSPEQTQPITTFYSLLTDYSRFTPRWHQEGIAVFLETWLSGGFGRVLGNFDEMYFRCMVLDSVKFPSYVELDAKTSLTNYLLGTLYYLYGARFCSYLTIQYGPDKLIAWFREEPDDVYDGFINKFKKIYGFEFEDAWDKFIANEKEFQKDNIKRLQSSELTPVRRLSTQPIGWVTQPYFEPSDTSMIFGFHTPNHLAGIQRFNLSTGTSDKIGTLPTPSLIRVASTAYDKESGLFFYTTKNNELYRDICVLETATEKTKILFKNCRVGDLAVSPSTHDLWGVLHANAEVSLTISPYPYRALIPLIKFNANDEVLNLSLDPSGKTLAAVLHRGNGEQSLVLVNTDSLKTGGAFKFETVSDKGSPENPSWSPDGKCLYWNAYTNGVSNIYRMETGSKEIEPLSNTLRGLFMPVYLNKDSLFVFEFTTDGFIPAVIPGSPANHLSAINYLGEKIVDKYPEVTNWALKQDMAPLIDSTSVPDKEDYHSLENLKVLTFVPVVSGFQNEAMLGIFTHISDALLTNDLTMEFGISPFKSKVDLPKFHLKAKYDYRKIITVGINYNPTDFYDLFNDRKRGMIGTKLTLGYTHYWIFDNPLKVIQTVSVDYYTDVKYINDNLVKVSQPDFSVFQSNVNAKDLRKSIGSIDFEEGNEFNFTVMAFGVKDPAWLAAGEMWGEWDNYSTWLAPHNIFHYKLASGLTTRTDYVVQAKYYFGGFGNRPLEDTDVMQFRKVFRFPGVPIYSLSAERFFKISLENELPPLRFDNTAIGQHYLSHISLSLYSQALLLHSEQQDRWVDIGSQINFVFRHWFNLESTLSAGIAKGWYQGGNSWEWFVSYKLLRN
ncbi:MAG: hypothetical protein P4L45_11570 [Ignavibacteriaceae bacterium]|nr:hypothetical protein [Ignavibacteriaceae bacterium]